jgi:hypothetical protein
LNNGCAKETPLKCADGMCVDPNKTNCTIAACPKETPAKCLNGACVKSISNCPTHMNAADFA